MAEEVWIVPCKLKQNENLVDGMTRIQMVEMAINDFFPKNFPVKTCDIQVKSENEI